MPMEKRVLGEGLPRRAEDEESGTKLIPASAVIALELYEGSVQKQQRSDWEAWDGIKRQPKVIVHI